MFLIGSPKHNSIIHTARYLESALPGLQVVGTAPGRVDPAGDPALLAELRTSRPDLILVGVGFPAQERLMARLSSELGHGVLIGEGGSFDFREMGGGIRRAPAPLRRLGLEWLGASSRAAPAGPPARHPSIRAGRSARGAPPRSKLPTVTPAMA